MKTFSIAFRDQSFNESEYAATVARTFATDHHELYVEADLSQTLEKLSHHIDEPFGDSSMIPTYHVCALARQHVTVALSGDGGDELFAGYTRYGVHAQRAWARLIPAPLRSLYLGVVNPLVPSRAPGKRYAANLCLPERDRYLDSMSVLYAWERDREVFSPDFVAACNGNGDPLRLVGDFFDQSPAADSISRLQYLDSKTYLAGDVLTKVDRMSMANSLEVRSPILDHVFAELAASLPVEWKFRGGEKKYILKKLAERVGVPREVIYRKKQGFAMPLMRWFRRELREEISRVLLEPRTLQRGYFQESGVRALLNEHFSGRRDRSQELWVLLVFEMWFRNFVEKVRPEAELAPAIASGDSHA